ncbi:cupin domain-containing protein [Sinomonas mesophila]|uniref:cupin domain-containing protein n=1 Tax=Sinomonas mesophila TaxID=1531955 RepID=UPI000984715E|nr:cupin domain-containing protein [Sinomonas mesophila]
MVKATVMSDATTADPGERKPKEASLTPGQTEVSFRLWTKDDFKVGIWEATPGVSKSTRPGYDEICQILSGSATITEADGTSFDIGPRTLLVTPAGWEGTWTIHETLRKVFVVKKIPASTD